MNRVRPFPKKGLTLFGFTLVELLLAATLISILFVGLGAHLRGGIIVWRRTTQTGEQLQRRRVAFTRLERDLANAIRYDDRGTAYGAALGLLPPTRFSADTPAWPLHIETTKQVALRVSGTRTAGDFLTTAGSQLFPAVKGVARGGGNAVGVQGISAAPQGLAVNGWPTGGGYGGFFQGRGYFSEDVGIGTSTRARGSMSITSGGENNGVNATLKITSGTPTLSRPSMRALSK